MKPSRFRAPFFLAACQALGTLAFGAGVGDRFGAPLTPGDVFPTTLEPYNPLNPADLASAVRSGVEMGLQKDGITLSLGMPNFMMSVSDQYMDWDLPAGTRESYHAKKYELGYGISSADLGWTQGNQPMIALGFRVRYFDLRPKYSGNSPQASWAYPDAGVSVWFKRFRLDGAVLNVSPLLQPDRDSLPGKLPREFSVGGAYGPAGNWLVSARLGLQDSTRSIAVADVGFEKLFFDRVTFRVGSQRKYLTGSDIETRQVESTLSGGIWYRFTSIGKGTHYPDSDRDMFSLGTLQRLANNVQVGGLVSLVNDYGQDGKANPDRTALFLTLGKAF